MRFEINKLSKFLFKEEQKAYHHKWSCGEYGTILFEDGSVYNPGPKDAGLKVKGLISKVFELQVLIPAINILGQEASMLKRSTIEKLLDIEDRLNIHFLPFVKGKEINVDGKLFTRLLAIHKKSGNFETELNKRITAQLGITLSPEAMGDIPKTLLYFGSPVDYDCTFEKNVMVIGNEDIIDGAYWDGAAYYIPQRNPVHIGETLYRNRTIKLKLDGTVFQMRGFTISNPSCSYPFKGTLQSVSFRDIKSILKDGPNKATILKYLEDGGLVCTADTLKKAKVGIHNVRFWYHNDNVSTRPTGMLGHGKIMFEQIARKMKFKHIEGLSKRIRTRIEAVGISMRDANSLVHVLNREKDSWNDTSVPIKEFTNIFEQVAMAGRPFGSNQSDEMTTKMALGKFMKSACELHCGTKRYFDKDGNVLFRFDKDVAIYLRGYLAARPNMEDDEIGLPRDTFDKVAKIANENGKRIEDLIPLARRMPITMHSFRKLRPVRRDDNFPVLTVNREVLNDFGGDLDGDEVDFMLFEPELFDYEDRSIKTIVEDIKKLPESHAKVVDNASTFFAPMRGTDSDRYPKNVGMLTELFYADAIGIVEVAICRIVNYLIHQGWTSDGIDAFIFNMEHNILDKVIDSKKHGATEVPDLYMLLTRMKNHKIERLSDAFGLIRGKCNFSSERLETVPKLIKNMIWHNYTKYMDKNTMMKFYPFHHCVFKAIWDFFPDCIENVTLDRDLHKGTFKNRVKLIEELLTVFSYKSLFTDAGFYETNINGIFRLTHPILEMFGEAVRFIRNKDISNKEKAAQINELKGPAFESLMSLATKDEGKVAVQILLIICAWDNMSFKVGSIFSFIFNLANPAVLTFVMGRLFGRNLDWFFTKNATNATDATDAEENVRNEYALVRKTAVVDGDFATLPPHIADDLSQKYEILPQNDAKCDTYIVIAQNNKEGDAKYEDYKKAGVAFHYVVRRNSGKWYDKLYQ